MAITIEPGIYLTGRFGVRIEDDVLVKRNGFEIITHSPKGLEEAIIYPPHYLNSSSASGNARDKQLINLDDPIFLGLIILFIALVIGIILIRKNWYKFY